MRPIVRFILMAALVGSASGGCGKTVDALGQGGAAGGGRGGAGGQAGKGGGIGHGGASSSTGGAGGGDHGGGPGTGSGGAGHGGSAAGSGGAGAGVGGATSTGGRGGAAGSAGRGGAGGMGGGMGGRPASGGASGSGGMLGGGGAGGSAECADNAACPPTSYCDFGPNDCGKRLLGTCKARPDGCIANIEPACGCDGHVYSTICEAARVGQDVSDAGGCPAPAGTFACGPGFCAHGTTYCSATVGGAISNPGRFSCEALPAACMSAPTCASCFSSAPGCSTTATGDLTLTLAVP